MLLWIETITDRKASDIERVRELLVKEWKNFSEEEKEEWRAGMKGCLNRSDLERIQNNIQLLADVLELGIATKDIPEIPSKPFYDEILINVEAIRNAYCIHSDTPNTPSEPLNSFQKWNDIEKILADVHEILLNNFFYYCGNELYAGESMGLLL